MVELHVTFSKDMYGPDSTSSITFEELNIIIEHKTFFLKHLRLINLLIIKQKAYFQDHCVLKKVNLKVML